MQDLELEMSRCRVCPRKCGADREHGKTGYCKAPSGVAAARAALHFWEEPCISGTTGSGTVFFSGCNLRCVYCQNHHIAEMESGKVISIGRLSDIFLELQAQNANNINLVTPSHYVLQIREALLLAKKKGLTVPIVYNCGGYESVEALQALDGLIDIYLTDFKYMVPSLAKAYSRAEDYPETAKRALAEMVRQVSDPVFDEEGMIKKGVIIRHLVLPGFVKEAKQVIRYLHETYGNRIYLSIMSQFTPTKELSAYPELDRTLTPSEYDRVVDYAVRIGVENGFTQEGEAASESFIPPFGCEGV